MSIGASNLNKLLLSSLEVAPYFKFKELCKARLVFSFSINVCYDV
jgi:hypothetical protein